MEPFSESTFEQKLFQLKDTHDSIANLSNWCLSHKEHAPKIISTWLSVLKRVKTDHRVLLFYLANDVIQYSKRKHLPFVDGFAPALQKATTMVREESIRNKILRLFKIWDDRKIYDESFLVDLSGLLTHGYKSTRKMDVDEFQPSVLYSRLKSCKDLEDDTDYKMKILNESELEMNDVEKLQNTIKEKNASEDVVGEIDEGIKKVKAYIDALDAEIKERKGLLDLLEVGDQFYEKDYSEAKVVVNAYKCFTGRVKGVKRRLEARIEELSQGEVDNQDNNAESSSQDYGVNFSSCQSFMNRNVGLGATSPDNRPLKSDSPGMKYSPDSTVDLKSKPSPAEACQSNISEGSVSKIKKSVNYVDSSSIPQPVPPVDNSVWDIPYPSLDQRLAFHNFSGQASFLDSSVNSLESSHINQEVKVEASSSEVSSSVTKQISPGTSSQDADDTPNDCVNTTSTSVGLEWKMTSVKDWESLPSTSLFEQPSTSGLNKTSKNVGSRVKSTQKRNSAKHPSEKQPETWSPNSDYCKELSPVSLEDNVENIDMELSDEDDKKLQHLNKNKNERNSSCVGSGGGKNIQESNSSSKYNQTPKKFCNSKRDQTDFLSGPQHNSNSYESNLRNLHDNGPSYSTPNDGPNNNYFPPPPPPPPLPPPPPPPPPPNKENNSWMSSSFNGSSNNVVSPPPLPPPPPPSLSPLDSFLPAGAIDPQNGYDNPANVFIGGRVVSPQPTLQASLSNAGACSFNPNTLPIPLIPPPPPPMQMSSTDYAGSSHSGRSPTPPYYAGNYNAHSPVLPSEFSSAVQPQAVLKNIGLTNQNVITPVYSTGPGSLQFMSTPSVRLHGAGYGGPANIRLQNHPSVRLQVPPSGGFPNGPPVFVNPRRFQILSPYEKIPLYQRW